MFRGKLDIEEYSETHWQLTKPLVYVASRGNTKNKLVEIVIPIGTRTDGASIPPVLRWFASPWGKHRRAAVLHDYLYNAHIYSRRMADNFFYEGMQHLGVKKRRAYIMYVAVRLFGAKAYRK